MVPLPSNVKAYSYNVKINVQNCLRLKDLETKGEKDGYGVTMQDDFERVLLGIISSNYCSTLTSPKRIVYSTFVSLKAEDSSIDATLQVVWFTSDANRASTSYSSFRSSYVAISNETNDTNTLEISGIVLQKEVLDEITSVPNVHGDS